MAKKNNIPPMPFNVGEWITLPVARQLPPDVRGLWVDMLCYMWASNERGVMEKPDGTPYTREEIIRLVGVDSSGSDNWLDKLIFCGLCTMRDDGAFCSRQMIKSEKIRAVRRMVGKKGGETTKAKMLSTPATPAPPEEKPPEPEQTELFSEVPEAPPPLTPEQKAADKKKKYKYADFVTLTRDEYAKLCAEYGEEPAKAMIDILNNYKGSKGRKYKSDYLTIRGWVKDKYFEDIQRYGDQRTKNTITSNPNGGIKNAEGLASGAIPPTNGASTIPGNEEKENYSERF